MTTGAGRQSPWVELTSLVRARLAPGRLAGRVASGAAASVLVNGIGAGVSLLVQMALAREMGQAGFGAYLYAMAWMNVALVFGKFELDTAAVRFIGSYAATGRWNLARGFLKFSRRATLAISACIAGVGASMVWLRADALEARHPLLAEALFAACLLLPLSALLLVQEAVLQGLKRFGWAQAPRNVVRPLVFGASLAVAAGIAMGPITPPHAVLLNVVGTVAALIFAAGIWRRSKPAWISGAVPEFARSEWVRTVSPLLAVSVAQVILSQQADVVVVGTMLTTSDAAHYGAASQLTLPLSLIASSVMFVVPPMISEIFAGKDQVRLQSLVRVASWAGVAATLPAASLLVVAGRWLLSWYGPGFQSAYPILLVLVGAQTIIGMVGALGGYLMTMTRHEREAAWIIGGSATLNLVLAVILTPRYGAVGTATATLIAATSRTVAIMVFVKRTMRLRIPSF